MAKEICKIAFQMLIYMLIIVALVFLFYPESSVTKRSVAGQSTQRSLAND